jgi:protein-disulfide isomerase
MFTAQDEGGNQGFGDVASIDKLNATIAGIDAAKVAADVKANMSVYQAGIEADKVEGQKVGINATPSFIIGTQVIQGAYPYPTFQAAIDAALE